MERLVQIIPLDRDFSAVDIANILYPDCVRYDREGRLYNRAVPVVCRMLNSIRGVLRVKVPFILLDQIFFN